MARKHIKHTDQEWLCLLKDCRSSGLTTKAWCEQHEITIKAFYYHVSRLRKKGFDIPQRTATFAPQEKPEAFCFDLSECPTVDQRIPHRAVHEATFASAIRIDFHGVLIEISNHAVQDTISNTFLALRHLCQAIFPEYQSCVLLQAAQTCVSRSMVSCR